MILDASPPEQTSFLVVWRCLETSLRKRCCCCCVCLSPFLPFTVSFSLVLVLVLVLSPSATVIPNHTNYGWIWLDCGPLDHVRSLETALAQDHPKSVPWRRSLGEDHHTDAPTHGWPETYRPPSCAAVARSGCNATSCTRTALDMMMWANALSTITNHLKGYSKSSQEVFLIEPTWRWFVIGLRHVTTWAVLATFQRAACNAESFPYQWQININNMF